MGGANGSRECAPDDELRDTHRATTHAKQADGFWKRPTRPTGWKVSVSPFQRLGNDEALKIRLRSGPIHRVPSQRFVCGHGNRL
jgi:hypothetical protein